MNQHFSSIPLKFPNKYANIRVIFFTFSNLGVIISV